MVEESVTNGVWFHILSQVFRYPDYIIAPEYRTGGGALRGDLFVIRVGPTPAENKAVFAFEGKRAIANVNPNTVNTAFAAEAPQLISYLKDITKGGTRGMFPFLSFPSISYSYAMAW
jgi:hypothetical protein